MRFFMLIVALLQGLFVVGFLAVLEAIVQAGVPDFSLPFSIWWGMLATIPGLGIVYLSSKHIW